MIQQEVILVNENDEERGVMEKMEAHRLGLLHRAFSVFIFDKDGRMLLQQRAAEKYHGGGLWTNACCSHPHPGEPTSLAATRRLNEELGFTTTLKNIFSFTYRAEVENGLTEHEFDHVFAGEYEGEIRPDPSEVQGLIYMDMDEIGKDISEEPQRYTSWFKLAFPKIEAWWQARYRHGS